MRSPLTRSQGQEGRARGPRLLIFRHPERLTIAELSRVLNEEKDGFDNKDAVERAVRKLVDAGLLECRAEFVVPTRAALYFEALDSD